MIIFVDRVCLWAAVNEQDITGVNKNEDRKGGEQRWCRHLLDGDAPPNGMGHVGHQNPATVYALAVF